MLSNVQIRKLLEGDSAIVKGLDSQPASRLDSLVQPASIDLTVGSIYIPPDPDDKLKGVHEVKDYHLLEHGATVLVKTKELIDFPADICGIMFPKNGHFALKGLSITNFGHVDPGFKGYLKYTVINFGSEPYRLEVGQRIASLLIFKLGEPAHPDWKEMRKFDPEQIEAHAKVLSRDFLDMERRIEKRVKEEVEGFIRKRERLTSFTIPVIGIVFAALFGLLAIFYPGVFYLDQKISGLAEKVGTQQAIPKQ